MVAEFSGDGYGVDVAVSARKKIARMGERLGLSTGRPRGLRGSGRWWAIVSVGGTRIRNEAPCGAVPTKRLG